MNVCITGTGFFGNTRKEIRRMAELLGLDYSGALVCNRSTHLVLASTDLILSEGNAKSQKLDRAKEWGIAIVTYAWLEDSVARGKILDVEIYLVHTDVRGDISRRTGLISSTLTPEQLRAVEPSGTQHTEPSGFMWSPGQASSNEGGDGLAELPERCSGMHQPLTPVSLDSHEASRTQVEQDRGLATSSPVCSLTVRDQVSLCDTGFSSSVVPEHSPCSDNMTASRKGCLTSQASCTQSPECMQVHVERPLKTHPKGSTAAAFHRLDPKSLTYYEQLNITHCSNSASFHFNLRDRSHCALVYYEDANADEHELAYADVLYCYSLKGGDIYIEHGYLFDKDDVQQHQMGHKFLACCEFWLTSRKAFQLEEHNRRQDDPEKLIFFCEKGWDRKSGQRICVSRHKMKSGKQFIR